MTDEDTQKVIEDLTTRILEAIKDHLASRPRGRAANYEALNALAIATSLVIVTGSSSSREPGRAFFSAFFNGALRANLNAEIEPQEAAP